MPALSIGRFVRCAMLAVGFMTGGPAVAAPAGSADQGVIAAAAGVSSDGPKTRLTVTLSKTVEAQVLVMERPDRIIIDLPEVKFHLPPGVGRRPEGLIASFRYGLFAPGRSRMVIDLAQPALVSRIAVETAPGSPPVLTLELTRTDREAFRKAASAARSAVLQTAAPAPPAGEDHRPVIILDPGHGGIDPGATAAGGQFEKDIVFAFTQRLRKQLEAGGRYRVLMTRDHDVFVPLGERVRLARAARADLLISIHADSIAGGPDVRGLTVYTGSERASDAESARMADRENRADAVAGLEARDGSDEIADILQDLTLRETRAFSYRLATGLVGELDQVAQLNKNPHRQAGFRVLRAPDVPSVLVELGYLSSRKDVDLLLSEEWHDRATSAMAAAIDRFFAARMVRREAAPVLP